MCMKNLLICTFIHLRLIAFFSNKRINMPTPEQSLRPQLQENKVTSLTSVSSSMNNPNSSISCCTSAAVVAQRVAFLV